MNNPNPITEADMLAYLRDVTAKYAPQFPELRNFRPTLNSTESLVFFLGYTSDDDRVGVCGGGVSWDNAATNLREQLGPRAVAASRLREQAAKLIAEADKLEGAK